MLNKECGLFWDAYSGVRGRRMPAYEYWYKVLSAFWQEAAPAWNGDSSSLPRPNFAIFFHWNGESANNLVWGIVGEYFL